MESSEYQNIFANEQSHGWYTGMRQICLDLLRRYLKTQKNLQILDAGCGTGATMQSLKSFGSVTGIDNSPLAVRFSKKRKAGLVKKQSIEKIAFPSNTFDLVTSFDVLCINSVNPVKALSEFSRVLKRSGWLLIRVPAFDFLSGQHDIIVHSGRRFTAKSLNDLLTRANFEVIFTSYANFFLFFPTLVKRRLLEPIFSRPAASDIGPLSPFLNRLVNFLLTLEGKIMRFRPLPFGVSVIILGRKK